MSQLWELVWGKAEVDPGALSAAIEQELERDDGNLDYRTRLLIRDSTQALEEYWGTKRLNEWLSVNPIRAKIKAIQHEHFDKPGFPLLKKQLMESTKPETIKRFLRDLGSRINKPVTLEIGGAIALILTGYLSRATTDIDVVNEVPPDIRNQRALVAEIEKRYGLMLTHFQSHYLPLGWEKRLHDLGSFYSLQVYALDVYDIFIGKLFSKRDKDLDDLRAIEPKIDKLQLTEQLLANTTAFLKEPTLKEVAQKNWYILFGENLPKAEKQ